MTPIYTAGAVSCSFVALVLDLPCRYEVGVIFSTNSLQESRKTPLTPLTGD